MSLYLFSFYDFLRFWRAPKITNRDYELRHVCLSVCWCVHLSVRMEQFDCQWTDIHVF